MIKKGDFWYMDLRDIETTFLKPNQKITDLEIFPQERCNRNRKVIGAIKRNHSGLLRNIPESSAQILMRKKRSKASKRRS